MLAFEERAFLPEAMDAHDADRRKLERSYQQLATINRYLSRMRGLLWRNVVAPARRSGNSPTVLEVGCGGGDVLGWLALAGRKAGVRLRLLGIDPDPRAVAHARTTVAAFPEVTV